MSTKKDIFLVRLQATETVNFNNITAQTSSHILMPISNSYKSYSFEGKYSMNILK